MYACDDPVFRQKEVLYPDYIPDNLPHREREIKIISQLINSALKILQVYQTSSFMAHQALEKQPQ